MHSRSIPKIVCVFLALLLMTACISAQPSPTPVPPTPTPVSKTLPEYDPDTIIVTFTGDECTSSVPTELPVGEHQFVLRDLSENNPLFGLWLGHLLDGHTYQDVLDLQSEPGEYYPKPSWLVHPRQKLVGQTWPIDKVYTFYIENEGEYGIETGSDRPPILWWCGSFQVVEVPSE